MEFISKGRKFIEGVLNHDDDPINRARIHILFYSMSATLTMALIVLSVYIVQGPYLQLIRLTFVIAALVTGIYKLVFKRNYKPAAHIIIWMLNMLVWTNIFLLIQALNIVTIQYIILTITCSFYMLSARHGMIYSIAVMVPVLFHFIIYGTNNIQVFVNAQQASDPVFLTVLLFNFFLMIFINYHFLKAFHFALNKLKVARLDEKMLNDRLKEAISAAEASSRTKSDFLSTMSHELRTPLNSVIGMSYVLLADNPREDQQENLKVLHFSAESLLSLINDILDFNKLEYGKLELEFIEFNPAELIKGIHAGLKFQAEEKGLIFSLHLDEKLNDTILIGDSTRLLQILFNLIGNAIKFTPKGHVLLRVDVVSNEEDSVELKFAVTDTGIGISDKHLHVIFEPFSQASSNINREFGGTGLGLAITKQLLELHDTIMTIDSVEGRGTTFEFKIKYKCAALGEYTERSSLSSVSANSGDLSDLRILVAEDNSMNVLLMRKLFQSWGINADFVVNGSEALEKVKESSFDVILMDIHMPVMDGYEASRQILNFYENREDKPWIIALTASVANDIHNKVTSAGLNDYISKPFNPVELKSRLGALSGQKVRNKV
ncbi:MAG: ATP-binding protein [Bacteroidota bacterium]